MHIAFLIRSLATGGAERAATALASEMARTGNCVSILCLTGTDSFYPMESSVNVRYLNMDWIEQESGVKRIAALLRRARRVRKAVRETKPDILVGMSWMMSVYAVFCTAGSATVSIGTERSNPFVLNDSRTNAMLRRFAARRCDGFICQTARAKSYFPKSAQKKIAVIPNAIFNPEIKNLSVPKDREKQITALGRLDWNKGFDVLLRAFALVHAELPRYTLCIFGDGELRNDLQALAETLQVADSVRFPGTDPQAVRTIAASSVFVLSSRSEGMPNALMEAMAAGVPCVSTRCDMGPEELITDGVNGLLVPTDDPHAMAQAILRILKNPALGAALSCGARSLRDTHALEQITKQWLAYFNTLL